MAVTEAELSALRYVIRQQGEGHPVTPTDVAHYLGVKSAAVTLVVDHLERAGHLDRRPHPTDRRSLTLVATDDAVARVDEMFGAVYETMIGVARRLDEASAARIEAYLGDLATALDSFAAGPGAQVEAASHRA